MEVADLIDEATRTISDWPVEGVTFRDISPLLGRADAFAAVIEALRTEVVALQPDAVVGIEARGFILGAPLALALGVGFVPVRKVGKLPAATIQASYELEYGSAVLEIHQDALTAGDRVVVIDDVLATGGTMTAAIDLVRRSQADPVGAAVMIELTALGGRDALDVPCTVLRSY